MKFIAIALNDGNPLQRNSITNFFQGRGWSFRRWVDDFWLVQVPPYMTTITLHEQIEGLFLIGKPIMVLFEIRGEQNEAISDSPFPAGAYESRGSTFLPLYEITDVL